MLLILWMMLTHSAFPHTHHEHEEHSHHGEVKTHTHHHEDDGQEKENQLSILDLFFQSHSHSNHTTQNISVTLESSDQVKSTQEKLSQDLIHSIVEKPFFLVSSKEKPLNRGNLYFKPHFFTCNTLRGPPFAV